MPSLDTHADGNGKRRRHGEQTGREGECGAHPVRRGWERGNVKEGECARGFARPCRLFALFEARKTKLNWGKITPFGNPYS